MLEEPETIITNSQILEEIVKSRRDLKSAIEASEARLLLKIESTNNGLHDLERENIELKERIEQLEIESKRKNLIIFGLARPKGILHPDFICKELNSLLDLSLKESDISDIYRIGKTDTCPIKVELCSYIKKNRILSNCKKLKGTNISIANDLSVKQRETNKILSKHLKLTRQEKNNKSCFIRNNKLFINNISYTAEQLEEYHNKQSDGEPKSNSAPPTPNEEAAKLGKNRAENQIEEFNTESQADKAKTKKVLKSSEASKDKLEKETAPAQTSKNLRSRPGTIKN